MASSITQLIEDMVTGSREKIAQQRAAASVSTPSATLEQSVEKLASLWEKLARDPDHLQKVAEPYSGSSDPMVQPPSDEDRDTTSTQVAVTEENDMTSQEGTETEPATDEDRDTVTDNSAPIAAATETPVGVADKVAADWDDAIAGQPIGGGRGGGRTRRATVGTRNSGGPRTHRPAAAQASPMPKKAGADNESEESPQEYASGEGTPTSKRIPFLQDRAAAIAFKKRQAVQVSNADALSGLFNTTAYADPMLHQQFDNAEEAGVKTKGS